METRVTPGIEIGDAESEWKECPRRRQGLGLKLGRFWAIMNYSSPAKPGSTRRSDQNDQSRVRRWRSQRGGTQGSSTRWFHHHDGRLEPRALCNQFWDLR